MKTISMEYSEYLEDLKKAREKSFKNGCTYAIELLKTAKRKHSREALEHLWLETDYDENMVKAYCEILGIEYATPEEGQS